MSNKTELSIDKQSTEQQSKSNVYKVLRFSLGTEDYSIKVGYVQTIIELVVVTPLPNTPKFIYGITNLRGTLIPVVDLREMFDMTSSETVSRTVVILDIDSMKVGILVDNVKEVLDIDFSVLQPPLGIPSALGVEYIVGIYRFPSPKTDILLVVDISKIINVAREKVHKFC